MKAVAVQNLSFAYGEQIVLEKISFAIEKGEYVALLGPNGSGKSTLLKLLLGLIKPQEGEIFLFGKSSRNFKNKEWIGYLPQRYGFDQRFPATVEEVVGMYGGAAPDLTWALKKVELEAHRNRLIGQLSGGQQQRALIARALVGKPRLLILDEPSASLDLKGQRELYQLLGELNRTLNLSIILVSHDLAAVAQEVERVIYLGQSFPSSKKDEVFLPEKLSCVPPLSWLREEGVP